MGSRRTTKTEQFDMDSLFDFNQGTTQPANASTSKAESRNVWDGDDRQQQFNGPSHDYNQYKQQVGLPMGSVSNVSSHAMFDGYNSGIGDMTLDGSWSTGLDLDTDVPMDFNSFDNNMPTMFFPQPANDSTHDKFINPNTMGGEEPSSNVGRLWPGMHSQQAQQAAMQKASQNGQPRQIKQQYQQQVRQPAPVPAAAVPSQAKRPSQLADPQVEERISRLLNQMRQNSTSNADEGSPSDLLPHIARMKKDEDEMDEDERLLASEEGKKLSSKERRQLRNKVSARAFRSRRKEYIGQLEGEVALKAQENVTLRSENDALIQENERYRGFIETILRHPAFGPFMNDISKDPSLLGLPSAPSQSSQNQSQPQQPQQQTQQTQSQSQHHQGQQQLSDDTKPDFLNFDASQVHVPQQDTERVNLATIPENDFSKLNINGFQGLDFNNFQSVNAFPVTAISSDPEPFALLNSEASLSTLYHAASVDRFSASLPLDALLSKLDRAASRTRV